MLFNTKVLFIAVGVTALAVLGCSHKENKNDLDADQISDRDANDVCDNDTDDSVDGGADYNDDDIYMPKPLVLSYKNKGITESSMPKYFTQLFENIVVFAGTTENEGRELWRSDGTEEGTFLVKDIYPGRVSSDPFGFVFVKDHVFFSTVADLNGRILYVSDGTAEGTKPVLDQNRTPVEAVIENIYSDNPNFRCAVTGSRLFFISENHSGGKYLMMTDADSGAVVKLQLFQDIDNFAGSIGENVYFAAADDSGEWKLWKNSGEVDKSEVVYDFGQQDLSVDIRIPLQFLDRIFFVASYRNAIDDPVYYHFFVMDGTAEGTEIIEENSNIMEIKSGKNGLFMLTWTNEIKFFDSSSGNISVYDLGQEKYILSFDIVDDKTLLIVFSEEIDDVTIYKLGIYSLTDSKMTVFHTFTSLEDSYVTPVVMKYNDNWYMIDGEIVEEYPDFDITIYHDYLYNLDLETGKKKKIDKLVNHSNSNLRDYIDNVTVQAGKIWISGNMFNSSETSIGYEPVVSDGTAWGTNLVKDINMENEYDDSNFYPIFYDRYLYYNDAEKVLYRKDFSSDDSNPEIVSKSHHFHSSDHGVFDGRIIASVYFNKTDTSGEYQTVAIDSESNELQFIKEGLASSITSVKQGAVFFHFDRETHKKSVFLTDGTENGTEMIKEENSIYSSNYPFHRKFLSNGKKALFYYLAGKDSSDLNYQIWATDGTVANMEKIFEGIHPYLYTFHDLILCGEKFLMSIRPGSNSVSTLYYGAYISDGTAKGTFEVFQCEKKENCEKIHVGCVNAQPLIFIKEFEPSKVTVSKIDENGDIGKTVFEINDADFPADPQSVNMESSEKHFFPMYTPDNGTELWKTDGTESGTVMVKDISSGVEGSNPEIVAVHEGTVYFTASDGLNGYELWKTDGTESGTVMVNDFFSGTGSSSVKEVTVTESGLVLSGKDSKGVDTLWLIKDY